MKHSAHSFIRALLLALTAIALASCTRNIAYATEESAGGAQPRVAMMSRKSAGIVPTGPALANSVQADAMEAELDGGAFQQNDNAVANGDDRILAAYKKKDGKAWKIWIITEWDRSATTVLFPDEY